MRFVFKSLAHRAAHGAAKRSGLNLRLGFKLLRDRRVSVGHKMLALAIGLGVTAGLIVLEIPLEGVLGALVPFLGLAVDTAVDGLEFVLLPLIVGALSLPFLVPRDLPPAPSDRQLKTSTWRL